MNRLSNLQNIPLSMAVFLATDTYDYIDDPNHISATSLLKPLRQIVLASRVPASDGVQDISSRVSSALGSAIHDGIERSWKQYKEPSMLALGYPKRVVDLIRINPTEEETKDTDIIPVYLEHRMFRSINGYNISGKCDFIGEGMVEDFKSTSVYTVIHNTKDDDYILQGSIYRWLAPKIITEDVMRINWIFTDWSKAKARSDKNYPQNRLVSKTFNLLSLQETERFIVNKLNLIKQYMNAPEEDIPECSDDELWRSDPRYKYYKNPAKTTRSTKNYDTKEEATLHYIRDGSVGLVKEVPGRVKACLYCPAFIACSQKDLLIERGDLEINEL